MRRAILLTAILICLALAIVAAKLFPLFWREGQSKTIVIQKVLSPDNRNVLELRQVITPVHGGPDYFDVTIARTSDAFGESVFSHEFGCTDFSSFRLWWTDPGHASIRYGGCDTGHGESGNTVPKPLSVSWKDVLITIDSSGAITTK